MEAAEAGISGAPESVPSASSQAARLTLAPAAAQFLGWFVLALMNQPMIALLAPSASLSVRVLHHLYDFGQLLALGMVSAACSLLVGALRGRFSWLGGRSARGLLTAGAVFVVGLATLGEDVANLAERKELSVWLLKAVLAALFAVALGATRLATAPSSHAVRGSLIALGAALAVVNARSLPNDYFGIHFMVSWLAALCIANACEGLSVPRPSRALRSIAAPVLAIGAAVTVVMPAKGDVLLRLYAVPSSVLTPLLAPFLSDERLLAEDRIPTRYRLSPWFRDRSDQPPVPATRAVVPSAPPIVMFFTIDSFRADVMEKPEHRDTLPELTRLRRESSYFSVARSPTASTMTTMASVFAGGYYSQLQWGPDKKAPLIEPTPRFPELLSSAGVRCVLIAGTLGRIYGRSGVARGFATEVTIPPRPKPATKSVDAIIAELDDTPNQPLFVYAHFIDPHAPYDLAGKKGSHYQRYVREIALVDRQIGRLRAHLSAKGLADRTYFIISADHGEGFGEHGTYNHARTAYEELVRVPLFFYLPGLPGQELSSPVTLMDVGPTVLDLFGLPAPGFWMGQSLLPLVARQATKLERPVVIDTGRRIQSMIFDNGHKVIFTRLKHTTEVYDLTVDPGELRNLAGEPNPAIRTSIQVAEWFFRAIRRKADDSSADTAASDGRGTDESPP